jgi:hypothetical protein
MVKALIDFDKVHKWMIRKSYTVAVIFMTSALGILAYSIYSIVVLKKTAFSYGAIVIAILVSIAEGLNLSRFIKPGCFKSTPTPTPISTHS